MKITVIVAVYNGVHTLQRCIDSVAGQTGEPAELIVIDAGSTDGTVEILQANSATIAYWESKPDRGIYHAWNKGLAHAGGDWICFLGADDYLRSESVFEQISPHLVNAYPQYRVVYGQLALTNENDKFMYCLGAPWPEVKRRFMQLMSLPHPGLMHHKVLFEIHGNFDESFKIAGDYEFLFRELRRHDALFVPGIIVAVMPQGGISSDPSHTLLSLAEVRRVHEKYIVGGSGWRWWFAYLRVRFRILLWRVLGESMARRVLDMGRICVGKHRHWTRT